MKQLTRLRLFDLHQRKQLKSWLRRELVLSRLSAVLSDPKPALINRHYTNQKKLEKITILGIESSCDDTAAAVVRSDRCILGEAIFHQKDVHAPYQGIVPHLAANSHRENIDRIIERALESASITYDHLNAIAVTIGPGLPFSLDVGLRKAKELTIKYKKPLVAVNHMEGHALVVRLTENDVEFPFLALLISGGHTQLVVCRGVGSYILLGETLDDAVGEAYDKIYRLLCPNGEGGGGKELEEIASSGNPQAFSYPIPLQHIHNCDFSFSGLKTAISQQIRVLGNLTPQMKADIAASFQHTVVKHLKNKVATAIQWCRLNDPKINTLVLSGGVACNSYIRYELKQLVQSFSFKLRTPSSHLCTDNGVMIAWAGIENFVENKSVLYDLEEIEKLRYEPTYPLDNSGKKYFSNAYRHLRNREYASSVLYRFYASLRDGTALSVKHYLAAAKAAHLLDKPEEAEQICKSGLKLYTNNTFLLKLMEKIKTN